MNVRKIIKEELKKVFSENYPLGTEYDSNSPWNQEDNIRDGERASQIIYKVIWYVSRSGLALLRDSSKMYVFIVESFENEEYKPYADIPEEFTGYDEDGFADTEEGEWSIDDYVIENFVNDNLDKISIGHGLVDYESGDYQMVEIDSNLKDDLISLANKYFSSQKESFINILNKLH